MGGCLLASFSLGQRRVWNRHKKGPTGTSLHFRAVSYQHAQPNSVAVGPGPSPKLQPQHYLPSGELLKTSLYMIPSIQLGTALLQSPEHSPPDWDPEFRGLEIRVHPDSDALLPYSLSNCFGAWNEAAFTVVVHLQCIDFYKVVSVFASYNLYGLYDFAFWNKKT